MNLRPHSLAAMLMALGWVKTASADIVLVDDFTTASTGSSIVQGSGILGGERDVVANGQATFSASAGTAQMTLPSGTSTFVLLDYDGLDGSNITSFLLGDLDLADGGSNDGVFIEVTAITGTVMATARIAESLEVYSQASIPISDTGMAYIPFSAFSDNWGDPADLLASAKRFFVRFNLDVGEAITVSEIHIGTVDLFKDGFE